MGSVVGLELLYMLVRLANLYSCRVIWASFLSYSQKFNIFVISLDVSIEGSSAAMQLCLEFAATFKVGHLDPIDLQRYLFTVEDTKRENWCLIKMVL